MTHSTSSAFRCSPTGRAAAVLAIIALISLATVASPVLAGGWKGGPDRGANREREASSGASSAQSIGVGGGRLLFGLSILRDYIGNIARGGPGEGATPHISPTDDWKGQVNTNICNFKYVCQK
jgi:hypothetical protein